MKRNTFILKCFLQFTCTSLDGSQKEGGNFLELLHKEGSTQKGGVPSEKGGFQPWRKLWTVCLIRQSHTKYLEQSEKNLVTLDKIRKVWYLLLWVFSLLLPMFTFMKGDYQVFFTRYKNSFSLWQIAHVLIHCKVQ